MIVQDVQRLDEKTDGLSQDIQRLDEKTDRMESSIQELNERTSALEEKTDQLDQTTKFLSEQNSLLLHILGIVNIILLSLLFVYPFVLKCIFYVMKKRRLTSLSAFSLFLYLFYNQTPYEIRLHHSHSRCSCSSRHCRCIFFDISNKIGRASCRERV